jgi:hypothetical protein
MTSSDSECLIDHFEVVNANGVSMTDSQTNLVSLIIRYDSSGIASNVEIFVNTSAAGLPVINGGQYVEEF